MLSGGWDKNVIINDVRVMEPVKSIVGPTICGESVKVRQKDGRIVTGSYSVDDSIQCWDMRNLKEPERSFDWNGGIKSSQATNIQESEKELIKKTVGTEGIPYLFGLALNYDESLIVAGGGAGRNEVRIFDYDDGRVVSSIFNVPGSVLSMDSAKALNMFAVGGADGTLRIASIEKQKDLEKDH